ncbi:hypothetical protein [Pseudovibrio sp. Tun.PSC04-5.I4]|uniref:hypothetical protein n=1 Tax=Pseudovibrio sp. Tun.PSC04-5.I4 TaxID=1798213 RepID=UPI000B83DB69|nr:hypothetical protein [Pseudovibrio sp. Tun.PSC04-5.I4]
MRRPTYADEFKREAVRLVEVSGRGVNEIACRSVSLLYAFMNWRFAPLQMVPTRAVSIAPMFIRGSQRDMKSPLP